MIAALIAAIGAAIAAAFFFTRRNAQKVVEKEREASISIITIEQRKEKLLEAIEVELEAARITRARAQAELMQATAKHEQGALVDEVNKRLEDGRL